MTALTRVELRRLLARRILHVSLLVVIVAVGFSLWGLSTSVRPAADIEQMAREHFEQEHSAWEEQQDLDEEESFVQQCLEDQAREREALGDDTIDFGCEWPEPVYEDFVEGLSPPSLVESYVQLMSGLGTLVYFLALLGGSTFTAAEQSHRTLGTWLTFEPRRLRVFGSKVLAAGLSAIPVSVLTIALVLLGAAALYRFNGVDDAITSQQWGDLGWMGARIVVLAVVFGLVGAAAGLLLKNTGAVLGIAVGYLLLVENMVNGLFQPLQKYLISNNLLAWVNDGHTIQTYQCTTDETGGQFCTPLEIPVSLEHGALVLGLVALTIIVVSWLVFRRRDVS